MAFRLAYCPDCDLVVPLQDCKEHARVYHPTQWLTLIFREPLPMPPAPDATIADQLDQILTVHDQPGSLDRPAPEVWLEMSDPNVDHKGSIE